MMLLFGLSVGVICIAGFNYAVKHLPPLVFSAAALADPALTGIISWVSGIEGIPNEPTIIGGIIIVIGVYLISSVDKSLDDPKNNSVDEKAPCVVNSVAIHDVELTCLVTAHSGVVYGSSDDF